MGKKIIAVWVCLVLAILAAGYLFTFQEKLRLNLGRITHTHEILSLVHDVKNNLALAEALVSDYVATGEKAELKSYPRVLKDIDWTLNQLKQMVEDSPEQEKIVKSLGPLIQKRKALLEKSISLRREGGANEAELKDTAKAGDRMQKNIQKVLNELELSEKKLLAPQWAREKAQAKIWLGGLALATIFSFSLLLLNLYFLSREVGERKRAEENLVQQQKNLRSLASQLTLAEERERRRIAVNLHDQIGQTLSLGNIKLEEAAQSLPAGSESLQRELLHIGDLMKQAISDTKSLIFKISSPILYELGFEAAVEWLVENIPKQHGIEASFISDDRPKPLGDDIKVLLFQAVSELMVNAVKHSRARNLKVCLRRDDGHLQVRVDDDGQGFEMERLKPSLGKYQGFGLFSIRERLEPFGGTLEVKSTPQRGTRVIVSVPIEASPGEPQ